MRLRLNPLLAVNAILSVVMFKKMLLATLIVVIGMWAAGYDVAGMKDKYWSVANKQAGQMSGRANMDDSDWGADAG